jgi:dolichol-phosphate mannosyltransferase
MLYNLRVPWMIAGFLGAMISSVWNYGVSSTITWKRNLRADV